MPKVQMVIIDFLFNQRRKEVNMTSFLLKKCASFLVYVVIKISLRGLNATSENKSFRYVSLRC